MIGYFTSSEVTEGQNKGKAEEEGEFSFTAG